MTCPHCRGCGCDSQCVCLGISFGAACPLSSVEKILVDAVAKLPAQKTEVFKGFLEQLRWFAGKQVKSVAVSPPSEASEAPGCGPLCRRQVGPSYRVPPAPAQCAQL